MTPIGLIAVAAASLCLCAAANATELPTRRSGLWEIKIKLTGGVMPTAKMHHCTDAGMDWRMSTLFNPLAPNPCSDLTVDKQGDQYKVTSVCRAGEKTVSQQSLVSGDFRNRYTVVMKRSTKETESASPEEVNLTLEGTYEGACKPDQKPGDIVLAGGMKVNVQDIERYLKSKR